MPLQRPGLLGRQHRPSLHEEHMTESRYGEAYRLYRERTGMFRVLPVSNGGGGRPIGA